MRHYSTKQIISDQTQANQYLELIQKVCNDGEVSSCTMLGILYKEGQGVPQNDSKAAEFFQKACDGGEPSACFALKKLAQ